MEKACLALPSSLVECMQAHMRAQTNMSAYAQMRAHTLTWTHYTHAYTNVRTHTHAQKAHLRSKGYIQ